MAAPTSPRFMIALYGIDLEAWREEFDMAVASDRQVLASIKDYAGRYINQHFDRLGVQVH